MTTFKKILVPIDFSPPSFDALEVAIDLAKQVGGALCLIHVDPPLTSASLSPLPFSGLDLVTSASREACEEQLLDAAAAARVSGVSNVRATLLGGTPASAIVEFAKREACDLIVIGTRGRSGLARMLGSVAERVLRHAPCGVLAVRHKDAAEHQSMEPHGALNTLFG
jgi:nucleotide-binding universal stress UspA family protein